MKLSPKAQTTLNKLIEKSTINSTTRMPSIVSIHNLLNEFEIEHDFDGETVNLVEYSSAGKTYVNSRHYGKSGKSIFIETPSKFGTNISMDSSSSYYSWNTFGYASKLVNYFRFLGKIK